MSYIKGEVFELKVNGKELLIRGRMLVAIENYIEHGQSVGGFLQAVISNNLKESFQRADDENRKNLVAFVDFLTWEAPATCWGSSEKYSDWVKSGGLSGLSKMDHYESNGDSEVSI